MTKQALRTLAHNVGTVSKAPHITALDTVRAQHNYESSVEVRRSEEAQALAGDCGIVGEQDEHTGILLDERYKVGRKLNEGSFGAVYAAVDLQKNIVYAAKFVTAPSPLPEIVTHARLGAPPRLGGRFAARLRKSILHEAAVLRRLGPHAPHIVQLICEHDQGLVLELAAPEPPRYGDSISSSHFMIFEGSQCNHRSGHTYTTGSVHEEHSNSSNGMRCIKHNQWT